MSSVFAVSDGVAAVEGRRQEEKKKPKEAKKRAPAKAKAAPAPKRQRRAAAPKKAAAMMPPPPPRKALVAQHSGQPPNDDPNYRALLAYGRDKDLAPVLKGQGYKLTPAVLMSIPPQVRAQLLQQIDDVLDGQMQGDTSTAFLKQGLKAVEYFVSSRTPCKIAGTTEECFADAHWRKLLARSKIKLGVGIGKMNPRTELLLCTAQIAARVHQKNKVDMRVNLEEPISIKPAPQSKKKK
jgi:hypothetical protein